MAACSVSSDGNDVGRPPQVALYLTVQRCSLAFGRFLRRAQGVRWSQGQSGVDGFSESQVAAAGDYPACVSAKKRH